MLSDMNPVRMKQLKEFDQNTQQNINNINQRIETNSKKLSEIKLIVNETKLKLDETVNKSIKQVILEMKDVNHKIRVLDNFIKESTEDFMFYKNAAKEYEEQVTGFKNHNRFFHQYPSKTLVNLTSFLKKKTQIFKLFIEDIIDTVEKLEDSEKEDKNLELYANLIMQCEISFNQLMKKATKVFGDIRRLKSEYSHRFRGSGDDDRRNRRGMDVELLRDTNPDATDIKLNDIIRGSQR